MTMHRGHIVDLAPNSCGYRVLQKAVDCKEEELLRVDPAMTLVNKHASHVSNKVRVRGPRTGSSTSCWDRAPPRVLSGAPTASSTVRFSVSAKIPIPIIFIDTVLTQVGEAPPSDPRALPRCLLEFATNEQGSQSTFIALKEGGKETLDCVVQRMCGPVGSSPFLPSFPSRPSRGVRHPIIVDLTLSLTGSQLIACVLAMVRLLSLDLYNLHLMIPAQADKDQRASLYDCIRGHVARLQDRLNGYLAFVRPSNPISPLPALMCALLHDRMRAYYRY
ncbi:hypothetical protein B0H14DRAFT_3034955 [Mycena olivaceomarginata]|nr:hypothetical protein B0H14DRAFT_3034955 [Mycena olivaceomarginata]